jgi:hypothetical protein
MSIFHHLLVGAQATGQMAVHLPSEMFNLVAECTDRARIESGRNGTNSFSKVGFPVGIGHLSTS